MILIIKILWCGHLARYGNPLYFHKIRDKSVPEWTRKFYIIDLYLKFTKTS